MKSQATFADVGWDFDQVWKMPDDSYPRLTWEAQQQAPQTPTLTDGTFRAALALWFSDEAAAIEAYGHISDWNTSAVTDMSEAFKDTL